MEGAALDRLCDLYGIACEYHDISGQLNRVPEETRRHLLSAMGAGLEQGREVEDTLAEVESRRWRRRLPPVAVAQEGDADLVLELTLPEAEAKRPLGWQVTEEGGRQYSGTLAPADFVVRERREVDGAAWIFVTATVRAPDAAGYHRLRLRPEDAPHVYYAECLVIVAPGACFRPEPLKEGCRLWGLTAQLYGIRSQQNWGIGDFTDLLRLVEFAAEAGADFVGLNPLHSPLSYDDEHASPYDPSSRLFLNVLYIDVESVPDFAESQTARRQVADERFQAELRSLRAAELVDYRAVGVAKERVLATLFGSFCRRHKGRNTARGREFSAYRRERGELLYRYASFQVVAEYWRERDEAAWGWPAWPAAFHDCRSAAVAELVGSRRERLEYFMYLQWSAERQLAAAAERARALGMAVGIYGDLALSSKLGGADTWMNADLYLRDTHLGAPPDTFNQAGQDWGLPPLNADAMREAEYRPFIDMLQANMTIGGALRMDHVMSLMRCFLIPAGSAPSEGAYVHYPFEELSAILALESRRNRCLVIGEDLGTVPEALRSGLRDLGVLGYRVLFFEKDEAGAYLQPEDYDRDVLAVISTHDLPTLAGFWQGADIAWRSEQALYPDDAAREQQVVGRAEDRARLVMALEKAGLWPADLHAAEAGVAPEMDAAMRTAVHRYLAKSESLLAGVQAEDLLGAREQANLPGTTREHPNWRRKLPLQLNSWREDPGIPLLTAAMREERPRTAGEEAASVASPLRASIPRATYRLQLSSDFGFADAERLVPYLAQLGISHVYCSPYLKARAGSTHGYDVVDHNALNPEIGDRAAFDRFCETLRGAGMAQILDMVPNHMAVAGGEHEWWLDILENGRASAFAGYFDIDWEPLKEKLRGKVLLPVLGDHYGNVLDDGQLKLRFDDAKGAFSIGYFQHRFPIDPREYPRILALHLELLRTTLPGDDPPLLQFESLMTAFGNLPARTAPDPASRHVRARDQRLLQRRLAELAGSVPDIKRYIVESLRVFNGDEQYPADTHRLHELLEAQAYRLAYWRVASFDINYRRFFDINDLASLCMENEEVFEATHGLVFELIRSGRLDGLRIDHPDGLYDPRGYFTALQQHAGLEPSGANVDKELPLYVLAEKILASDENLRDDWPVHGTTGYEFADLMNRFFVRPDGLQALEEVYADFLGRPAFYEEVLHAAKRLIMQTSLASELNVLAAELDRLAEEDPHTRDFGLGGLRNALLETVACFPVYRTYTVDGEVSDDDRQIIDHAVDAAKRRSEAADTSVFEFLRDVLLNRSAAGRGEELRERVGRFGMRLQQFTSPVAAKGMEDTAFYRYARLISLNEVGGDPGRPVVSDRELHEANARRLARWPHSMLASSTHDTKRSEDVRARIAVLSEFADEWRRHATSWSQFNARNGDNGIDRNTEYFLYQTLLGIWPTEGRALSDQARGELLERLAEYMNKAVKEAKQRTSWINPDEAYETALQQFVETLLDPQTNSEFMDDFLPFQRRIARLGLFNSLSQLMLKLTCPGVPDIYQGNELWRFDLVDPDNRRPVDFRRRSELLNGMRDDCKAGRGGPLIEEMARSMGDGRLKLFLTWRALEARRQYPGLFEHGRYLPLRVEGNLAEHVFAFARRYGDITVVVAVLKWLAELVRGEAAMLEAWRFAETTMELPAHARSWSDGLTGEPLLTADSGEGKIRASVLFGPLPVALLIGADTSGKGADEA